MMKILKSCFEFFWKGIVIGVLNLVSLILAGGILTSFGMKFPEVKSDYSYILFSFFISGFVTTIICGIIVKHLNLQKFKVLIVLLLLLFLNSVTQIMESLFFAPGLVSWNVAPTLLAQQFIMYLFISIGITLLFRYSGDNYQGVHTSVPRNWVEWLLRILLCSISYVIYYFIFGFINASLFTGEYYKTAINGLHLPSTFEIIALEPIRAIIMVVSIIPLVNFLRLSKRRRMVVIGMFLFIVGGFLPMIQQLNTLPTVVVITTIFEMFFQNFLLGITTTFILLYEREKSKGLSTLTTFE